MISHHIKKFKMAKSLSPGQCIQFEHHEVMDLWQSTYPKRINGEYCITPNPYNENPLDWFKQSMGNAFNVTVDEKDTVIVCRDKTTDEQWKHIEYGYRFKYPDGGGFYTEPTKP